MQITPLAKARKIECKIPTITAFRMMKPFDVLHCQDDRTAPMFNLFLSANNISGTYTYCPRKKTWLCYINSTGRIC